ncbi:hypothetical protein EFA69_16100 [Rufibacter immobilis]|uniref:Uncharacterized protein n=1 Tax=Rufibacter immobilis TaxID=1348778 RepID=A0A3M9MQ45_9BACT|nr:hypothetical protein [Rufibacter immobilis]RNI27639.1 hypothetical protein EFA69_16100 [Rufibacter immobilis]
MTTTTLSIAVKPYTLKYLEASLFLQENEIYKLSKLDAFGLFLNTLMRRPLDDIQYHNYLKRYTAIFQVSVKVDEIVIMGFKLTPQGMVDFNNFVEGIIRSEFHAYVDYALEYGSSSRAKAFLKFREKYNMSEEDYPFETMKKSYDRYRERKLNKITEVQEARPLKLVA